MALRRDVFPAEVTLPDGRCIQKCRAFITDTRLVVWTHNANSGIVSEEFRLVGENGILADRSTLQRGRKLQLLTADGEAFVNRGHGCGCGSPLKQSRGLEDTT